MRALHDVHRVGDVAGLGAEQQDVSRLVFHLGVELGGVRGERDDARIGHRLHQIVEIRVQHHVGHVMVVEARTAQLGVAQVEAQRLHQMQNRAGHCAQADGRTGVAGNTRRVIAQVRRHGFGGGGLLGGKHRVHHGDGVAVCVGHQLVRPVIRLAIAVFEHFLDFGFGIGWIRCALGVVFCLVRHSC